VFAKFLLLIQLQNNEYIQKIIRTTFISGGAGKVTVDGIQRMFLFGRTWGTMRGIQRQSCYRREDLPHRGPHY